MDDHQYTAADLMSDTSFRAWVYKTDEAACLYWDNWMLSNTDKVLEVEIAKTLLSDLQVKSEVPTQQEMSSVKEKLDVMLNERARRGRVVMWRKVSAVAASVLIVFATVSYFFMTAQVKESTDFAVLKTVVLPDGSTVLLNAHSSLHYKKHWLSWKEREVWLDGEAFFTVTHKPEGYHPKFVVHTKGLDVSVMGTEFNVNTRHDKTDVILEKGKVIAHATGKEATAGDYMMHPGQMIHLQSGAMQVSDVDPAAFSGWRFNRLTFNNIPLYKVMQALEDNYGYQFTWKSSLHVMQENFTGSCPANNAQLLLHAISSVYNIRVTVKDKSVVFE